MQERTPLQTIETYSSMPKLTEVLYCLHLTSKKCRQYSTLFRKVPPVQHFFPDVVLFRGRWCNAKTQKSYSPIPRTREKSVHNYFCDLAHPLVYSESIFRKKCGRLLLLIVCKSELPYILVRRFFDAKTYRSAVLSALDVKKVPTVQHFVPKSADRTALFSWIWCYFVKGDAMRKRRNRIPMLYGPTNNEH